MKVIVTVVIKKIKLQGDT